MSIRFALFFYGLMSLGAIAAARFWAELDPWRWPGAEPEVALAGLIGAGVGLALVGATRSVERYDWARALTEEFRALLGPLSATSIAAIAVASSIGEELLFRGLLQQLLAAHLPHDAIALAAASLLFGIVHIGPKPRLFLPWTIMALIAGLILGALFWLTGSLAAPIAAHFTVNYLNLHAMRSRPQA